MIGRTILLGVVLVATLPLALTGPTAQPPGGAPPAASNPASEPPYRRRGDEVEARYRGYRERLEREFEVLGPRLQAGAPDLYPKLKAATPEPIPYGYQILPKIIPDMLRSTGPSRAISTPYSWPLTDALIDADLRRLDALEARLDEVAGMPREGKYAVWEKVVDDYVALAKHHKLIANHIQYNRLWQGEIARDRAGYDYMTTLHDAVIERQAILDAMQTGDPTLNQHLRIREQALLTKIRQRTDVLGMPSFVGVEHPEPRHWIIRVPVYTDIENPFFVEAFKSAVENAWHVQDGRDEFRVALDFRSIPASQLYPGGPPARGDHIDLVTHIGRFPRDGAVLTTGANTTHVLGHSINLGPYDIAPNVLAHEFGHILGFVDGYFRGYRDRGSDGYEVLEVLTDPDDVMSAPGIGRVARRHFERLLDARGAH